MGANAVTTVPVYVAGEVLTAADLNITNSGIPVFATSVERDAAFGGTGEKTLAEGQYAYLESTNATQFYDGASWQPVGVQPGLVVVKAETAFSAVASFTADNIFTASYTNYLILVEMVSSAAAATISYQLRVGGVTAATNYNNQSITASSSTISGARLTSQTSATFALEDDRRLFPVEIGNPAKALPTTFYVKGSTKTTNVEFQHYTANHTDLTAYDGIIFTPSTGTITGSYTVYGYGIA